MAKMLRLSCAFAFCLIPGGIAPNLCFAQQANCETSFNFEPSSQEPGLLSLFRIFSHEQRTSLLVEIPYAATSVKIAPGSYSLNELTKMFVPALHCETVDGVLHIFDENVVSITGNALNYRFAAFEMPSNVDRFRILLKERLAKEPFAPHKDEKTVIQKLGGGISWNADQSPLPERTYHNIQARNLMFAIATRYVVSSVIYFPTSEDGSTDLKVWKFAADHWYWSINQESATTQ